MSGQLSTSSPTQHNVDGGSPAGRPIHRSRSSCDFDTLSPSSMVGRFHGGDSENLISRLHCLLRPPLSQDGKFPKTAEVARSPNRFCSDSPGDRRSHSLPRHHDHLRGRWSAGGEMRGRQGKQDLSVVVFSAFMVLSSAPPSGFALVRLMIERNL